MNRKRHVLLIASLIGLCFVFFLGTIEIFSSGEENSAAIEVLPTEKEAGDTLTERPVFISIPDLQLERPPVQFYHDKHTNALKKEGCGICHPENKNKDIKGEFTYSYPKIRDEKDKETLMNSYHNDCIGCHNKRTKEGKESGAVTCGECHVKKKEYEKLEYLPIVPDYYQPAADIYHQDCIACHKEGKEPDKKGEALDWGHFYVKAKMKELADWPEVAFDYYLHHKHEKALEKKCELCHHIYNEEEKKLVYEEETESSCRDCHREKDVGKERSFRNVAHSDCITCHMEREKENKDAGPSTCAGCHAEEAQRTVEEMADVPRQDRKQKETYLIKVDDAIMKGVPFNHKAHEGYTRSCRSCHHETMKPCKECHTLKGDTDESGGVTLAEAYHEVSSEWSCIGCHESKTSESSCAGCHHARKNALTETSLCIVCHSGPKEETSVVEPGSAPGDLLPDKLDEEMKLSALEKDYEPSKFPHLSIIKKLTDISNESKLAKKFHAHEMSVCMGCHHSSPMEAKKPLPPCSTCHSVRMKPRKYIPTLFGAYHRQCLSCHEAMDLEIQPRDCTKCHDEKPQLKAEKGKE